MAGSFKLSTLTVRKKKVELPTFEWARVLKEKKLGSGTYGNVYLSKYGSTPSSPKDVVKKLKNTSGVSNVFFERGKNLEQCKRSSKCD